MLENLDKIKQFHDELNAVESKENWENKSILP